MFVPSPFGVMLKSTREDAGISQGELADVLGKTAQYISNIEKGKNNSPPDDADLQKLIHRLSLNETDAEKFRLLAYADRGMLPPEMFAYISQSPALLDIIKIAINNQLPENFWDSLLQNIK